MNDQGETRDPESGKGDEERDGRDLYPCGRFFNILFFDFFFIFVRKRGGREADEHKPEEDRKNQQQPEAANMTELAFAFRFGSLPFFPFCVGTFRCLWRSRALSSPVRIDVPLPMSFTYPRPFIAHTHVHIMQRLSTASK